jgi:hypothetical protein
MTTSLNAQRENFLLGTFILLYIYIYIYIYIYMQLAIERPIEALISEENENKVTNFPLPPL